MSAATAWKSACTTSRACRKRVTATPDNFHDVDAPCAFVADPMAVVQGVYRRFGLDLSPAAEAAMRQWIAKNPQGKFGRHVLRDRGIRTGSGRHPSPVCRLHPPLPAMNAYKEKHA